jgi:fluoride ion exporter CrcB/FEX
VTGIGPWPLLLVALGGATGSVLRYLVSMQAAVHLGAGFPWGTLAVNVLGSAAIGLLGGMGLGGAWRLLLMTGLLGGFTTFSAFSLETGEPEALPANATYLIIAEPDTPGSVLTNALAWASEGDASLVALRDGRRSPVYLGMGRVGHDDALSTRPMLMLGKTKVMACLGKQSREGKLSEAGQLALRLATRCKSTRCGSLVVGIDDLALAQDIVAVTRAARRARFERVGIGGRVGCDSAGGLDAGDAAEEP